MVVGGKVPGLEARSDSGPAYADSNSTGLSSQSYIVMIHQSVQKRPHPSDSILPIVCLTT